MAHSHDGWSPENATKAYLRTIKMGKRDKEPDEVEFISALAGGNNARLMVEICGSIAGSTTIALVAAARQTDGRVVCILPGQKELNVSKSNLSRYSDCIEFKTGDPLTLLTNGYKGVDFVAIDCKMEGHDAIFRGASKGRVHRALIVGYNAQHRVPYGEDIGGYFLPIGEGLWVSKVPKREGYGPYYGGGLSGKRSKWVVRVDKCTGEEHVYRVTHTQQKVIQA